MTKLDIETYFHRQKDSEKTKKTPKPKKKKNQTNQGSEDLTALLVSQGVIFQSLLLVYEIW